MRTIEKNDYNLELLYMQPVPPEVDIEIIWRSWSLLCFRYLFHR